MNIPLPHKNLEKRTYVFKSEVADLADLNCREATSNNPLIKLLFSNAMTQS